MGWFFFILGILLLLFRRSVSYHKWMKRRLTRKGFANVEERVQNRSKLLNTLAIVYIITGIVMMMYRH